MFELRFCLRLVLWKLCDQGEGMPFNELACMHTYTAIRVDQYM